MSLNGVENLARRLSGVAEVLNEEHPDLDPETATDAARCLLLAAAWVGPARLPTTWQALRALVAASAPIALCEALLQAAEQLPESCLQHVQGLDLDAELVAQLALTYNLSAGSAVDTRGRTIKCFVVESSSLRRRSGSHYTPRALARLTVARTLGPLLANRDAAQLTALRICDPALGGGIFLEEAGTFVSERLAEIAGIELSTARRHIFAGCLYGIDRSRLAVILTKLLLWRASGASHDDTELVAALNSHLVCDDALGQEVPFADFDAVLGNPPWVAFVGRAAQPLPKAEARELAARFTSFKKYRTLHGLFVERAVHLLRVGGRIGFVLPTSVADLDGYAPTRAAHDELCVPELNLPNFGDRVFEGVFQPSMVLISERTAAGRVSPGAEWSLERTDLDPAERALLARLSSGPTCPPHLFGERGYQTDRSDRLLFDIAALDARHVPLRTGSEVREYAALPPRCYCDPSTLSGRLRPPQDWVAVKLLIRQTARYPIVAVADDRAFRNSVLAGFEDAAFSWQLLLAYLNSTPVRWFHYQSRRDARQGMPQTKVSHLRSLPRPPQLDQALGRDLHGWGERLGTRNIGIHAEERRAIDSLVGAAWQLSGQELEHIWAWGRLNEPPRSRRRTEDDLDTVPRTSQPSSDARADG